MTWYDFIVTGFGGIIIVNVLFNILDLYLYYYIDILIQELSHL